VHRPWEPQRQMPRSGKRQVHRPWEPPAVATTVKARRGKLPPADFGGTPTPGPYGGKPLRVCAERTPEGERQMPAEGDPPAALVSPPAFPGAARRCSPQRTGSPPAALAQQRTGSPPAALVSPLATALRN
jgi:hypothetical protein